MIWVTYRQFRTQAVAGLAALAAITAYFVITGVSMHRANAADLAGCPGQNDCYDVLNQLQNGYSNILTLSELLVILAPALLGMFWGAPLIGRELETGTHQLAWNQSVMRGRWLVVKLSCVGAAAVAAAGLLGYLLTWWAAPLDQIAGSRFAASAFASRDIVPLAYAAFAFALGTATGLLMRRTIPAMAVTLAVFIGIQILMPNVIRPHLMSSTTVTFPLDATTAREATGIHTTGGGSGIHFDGLPVPEGAWVLAAPPVEDSAGQMVAASAHPNCMPSPGSGPLSGKSAEEGPDVAGIITCLARYNLHQSITYQPARNYWPLQWSESGIFAGLAGALSGFCFWWIRRGRTQD